MDRTYTDKTRLAGVREEPHQPFFMRLFLSPLVVLKAHRDVKVQGSAGHWVPAQNGF